MDFKQIQELIQQLNDSQVGELKIKQGDFSLHIRTKNYTDALLQSNQKNTQVLYHSSSQQLSPPPQQNQNTNTSIGFQAALTPANSKIAPAAEAKSSKSFTIKSPMIGTFYRASSPDKPLFVKIGDRIEKGMVICLIEAMKLYNEIEAEVSGTLVKVYAEDSKPVQYDQDLFEIELD